MSLFNELFIRHIHVDVQQAHMLAWMHFESEICSAE